jgi:UDP:flavonoid glycosyltransferase YjiC (YdhE family)
VRILLTAAPGAGHLFPLVPLAWALRSTGHDLLLATAGRAVALGAGAGLPTVDVAPGTDMNAVIAHATQGTGGFSGAGDAQERAIVLFAALSRAMLDGLRRCAQDWQPHVVIYEGLHAAGAVVAAERGVPGVEHRIGWAAPPGHMVARMWPALTPAAVVPVVATIGVAPPGLSPVPDPGWSVRPVPYTGGAPVPDGVLTAPQLPRVLVTLGTVAPQLGGAGIVGKLIEALVPEPVEQLVALGADPEVLGPLPPSVHAHRWVPLTVALPHCSVIVHHGGAGTSLAAIAAGIPQVVVPQGADQFLNADSMAQHGCAIRSEDDPEMLRTAVRRALSGELDERVAALRDEAAAMPTPSAVAADLTSLLTR